MILFSHRGNLHGPLPERENSPRYIEEAISLGYKVEIDVWSINGIHFLGHDGPAFEINHSWLENKPLLCHAKNVEALESMISNPAIHCFWHEEDKYTITSKGYVVSYPGFCEAGQKTIVMKPEFHNTRVKNCYGICSDYISRYKDDKYKEYSNFTSTR